MAGIVIDILSSICISGEIIGAAREGGEQVKKLTYMKPKVVGTANVHPC